MVLMVDGRVILPNWGPPTPVAVPFLLSDSSQMALPAVCQWIKGVHIHAIGR